MCSRLSSLVSGPSQTAWTMAAVSLPSADGTARTLVAGGLDGAALMGVHMAGIGGDDALVRAGRQAETTVRFVCVPPTRKWTSASSRRHSARMRSAAFRQVRVGAVAGRLLQVCLNELVENARMGALAVIGIEIDH